MDAMSTYTGYSADVRMYLLLNGHTLRIGQMGPNFLLLDDTVNHPATDAEIVLSVDGQAERWKVHLPNGISSGQKLVPVSTLS